jgi:hypothetical protein
MLTGLYDKAVMGFRAKTNPAGDYTCGVCQLFVRHQAGLFLWAFTHCSVSIVGGDPGL